jgi:serine phosphatase RsbU (regulator of sigma subunit)
MTESANPHITGITRRRWTGFVLIWIAVGILFWVLYQTSRQSVMSEIRSQAKGVAVAVAAGIHSADLAEIRGPEDIGREAFQRIQGLLDRVSKDNPDVRFVYTMRRATHPGAQPSDYVYIVDRSVSDDDGDGFIGPDEISEAPGNTYDASELPAMVEAWQAPSADREVTPDPPYPDLMSGYAPIKDEQGITRAIVGVDIVVATVRRKMFAIRAVHLVGGCVLALLLTMVVQLYYVQRESLSRNLLLTQELSSRNSMLRAANHQLARYAQQVKKDLRLKENLQSGLLPETSPHRDRMQFDKLHLACDVLGGDLFDAFRDDEDHVALYMADVAGPGVNAALISGLLNMAVSSIRQKSDMAHGHLYADLLRPGEVLHTLNEMLVKELPAYDFITMSYGFVDLATDTLVMSSAGQPPPVHYRASSGTAVLCEVPTGMALGLAKDQDYPVAEIPLSQGDLVVFYTGGVTEALDGEGREFGDARMLEVVAKHGHLAPADLIQAIRTAVEAHRANRDAGGGEFSLLAAQLHE